MMEVPERCPKCATGRLGPPRYDNMHDQLIRTCTVCRYSQRHLPADRDEATQTDRTVGRNRREPFIDPTGM